MTDDIVTRLREQAVCTRSECDDCDLHRNAADEIERLRKDLELAIQVKQFVSFWWDDPSKVGECCAAWDNLPEEVRMWVLE